MKSTHDYFIFSNEVKVSYFFGCWWYGLKNKYKKNRIKRTFLSHQWLKYMDFQCFPSLQYDHECSFFLKNILLTFQYSRGFILQKNCIRKGEKNMLKISNSQSWAKYKHYVTLINLACLNQTLSINKWIPFYKSEQRLGLHF